MFSILFENKPELKFADKTEFSDINAEKIFNENILKYLCYSISIEEIEARKEFFSQLLYENGEENAQKLISIQKKLTELERVHESYLSAKTKIQVLLTGRYLCKIYSEVVNSILRLDIDAKFISNLKTEIQPLFEDCYEISKLIKETDAAFEVMSKWRLTFGGSGLVFMKKGKTESDGLYNTLISCGNNLKITDESFRSDTNIKVPAELSDKLFELYPEETKKLTLFISKFIKKINFDILGLKEEIMCYIELKKVFEKSRSRGIIFTYANITNKKEFKAKKAYDITLLTNKNNNIVPNDIDFSDNDTICFLCGANGGGKTTYLRNVAINLIFALAGFPVFAEKCEVYHFKKIFTHFPVNEGIIESGRLEEENFRAGRILEEADGDTFILFNETFSGTNTVKGIELALSFAEKAKEKGAFMLFVTHFYDVSESNFTILRTAIEEGEENQRTYIIKKGAGKKLSYAEDILDKYGLSLRKLRERFGDEFEA